MAVYLVVVGLGQKFRLVKGWFRQPRGGGEGKFTTHSEIWKSGRRTNKWKINAMQTLLPDFWGQKLTSASQTPPLL